MKKKRVSMYFSIIIGMLSLVTFPSILVRSESGQTSILWRKSNDQ